VETPAPAGELDATLGAAVDSRPENVSNPPLMRSTIREVAARAGVSVSTVSRVLNDYPFVSDAARRRVLDTMAELDYRPDMAARSMRTGTSKAVGFVVADISNPLFATIAKGVDAVLYPHGYSLVLANSGNDPAHEADVLAALRQRRLDGLIAAVADESADGLAERLEGFATVLFDRDVPGSAADAVCSDHEQGVSEALAHLARLGHERVALAAGSQAQLGSRARVVAFRKHAERLALSLDAELFRCVEPTPASGYRVTRELLELADPPSAVIIGHNQLTVGVLEALRDLGVRLTDDLSLIACDDVDVTRLHDPPIDVVQRDLLELGEAAGRLLLERLVDRDAPPRRILLPTRLVSRSSTAPPRVVQRLRTA
jgi:LacI family transcriptional regulator